jgi:hypothetical protein
MSWYKVKDLEEATGGRYPSLVETHFQEENGFWFSPELSYLFLWNEEWPKRLEWLKSIEWCSSGLHIVREVSEGTEYYHECLVCHNKEL